VALAVAVLLIVCLSFVRFPNLLLVMIGVVVGFVWVNRSSLGSRLGARRRAASAVAFGLLVAGTVVFGAVVVSHIGAPLPLYSLTECTLIIRPVDVSLGTFLLQPSATYSDSQLEAAGLRARQLVLSEQTLHSSGSGGFLTNTVEVPKPVSVIPLTLAAGAVRNVTVDFSTCPELSVSLRHFPAGSFYQAENPEDSPQPYPFGDLEDTSWKVGPGDPSVRFSYVRPPFNSFRTALQPLIGLSSAGSLLDILLGAILVNVPKVADWITKLLVRLSKKKEPPAAPPPLPTA